MVSSAKFPVICCLLFMGLSINANDLVITNTTIISPERESPLSKVNVLLREGKIHTITSEPITAENEIDGSDYFLIPGLIDSHTHLRGVPGMQDEHFKKYKDIAEQALAQIPKSYLYFGFTSVIDLNSVGEAIAAWNMKEIRPHAYFCGAASVANGYPMAYLPKDIRFQFYPYFLYDERQKENIPEEFKPELHTPAAVVERMKEDGAICVKTHYETGFGQMKNLVTPTIEMIRNLVDVAHHKDMPVFIHANSQEAQTFAVKAGAHVIAHGMWHWDEQSAGNPTPDITALIKNIIENDIGYQPTIQVIRGEPELFNEDFFEKEQIQHAIPGKLIEWYKSEEGRWFRDNMSNMMKIPENIDSPYTFVSERYKVPFTRVDQTLELLVNDGARLLFGSDTPSGPFYTQFPGVNGWMEMHRWKEAGVSLEALFKAATQSNARLMGLEDKIGTVEIGKDADLLLLRSNPLVDIRAYDEIEWVILQGKPIKRSELSAISIN